VDPAVAQNWFAEVFAGDRHNLSMVLPSDLGLRSPGAARIRTSISESICSKTQQSAQRHINGVTLIQANVSVCFKNLKSIGDAL
jgi:hypothetical protein